MNAVVTISQLRYEPLFESTAVRFSPAFYSEASRNNISQGRLEWGHRYICDENTFIFPETVAIESDVFKETSTSIVLNIASETDPFDVE